MEKSYYIISRHEKSSLGGNASYVYSIEGQSHYVSEDYIRAIRFETKEVALGLTTQLSKRNTNYVFHALEVKTAVIAIDE